MTYIALKPSAFVAMLAATAAISMSSSSEAATRVRLECRAEGAIDISMKSRYEVRSTGRKTFTTEFEAAPNLGFAAGNQLVVQVKGINVGRMTLETIVGGDVVGDLNFDTRPQPPDSIAFPANWPAPIRRGAVVKVLRGTTTVLGCTLR